MAEKLTQEMADIVASLGDAVKKSDEFKNYSAKIHNYTRDEDLNRLVSQYNVQQGLISDEYAKESPDKNFIEALSQSMTELYKQIVNNQAYKEYLEAEVEYQNLIQEIHSELDYKITGRQSCSHDCGTCGGCQI